MIKEQSFFLQVLKDHLHNRKTDFPEGLKLEIIYKDFKIHQLEGIFYYQCKQYLLKNEIDAEISNYLQKSSAMTIYHSFNREKVCKKVFNLLSKNSIRFFVVKGDEISKYYPNSRLRTMGDIDLVIDTENVNKVRQILNNYASSEKNDAGHEFQYFIDGYLFEVHDHLIYPSEIYSENMISFFNECWNYVYFDNSFQGTLDINFHFIFLIQHLRTHLMRGGVGFRQFFDLAILAKRGILNWDWIEKETRKIEMWDFTSTCMDMCQNWFSLDLKRKHKKIDDTFFEEATLFIFKNGVFGHTNNTNRDYKIVNRVISENSSYLYSKIQVVLLKLFPSYSSLRYLEKYRFLNGKPLLLPLAWIVRIINGLKFGKIKNRVEWVSYSNSSKNEIEKKVDFLKKWYV